MRDVAIEMRDAAVHRDHASAREVARHAGLAAVADAELLPHEAARAVAADEVLRTYRERRAAAGGLDKRLDTVAEGLEAVSRQP